MKSTRRGFTLVELLITIVVIAILASVTVVSYQGLQNRAHDSIVQSELRKVGQSIEVYMLETSYYPSLSQFPAITSASANPRVSMNISKDSFDQLEYCYSYYAPERDNFAVVGTSKSGNKFYVRHDSSAPKQITAANYTPCPDGMPDGLGMPRPINAIYGKSGSNWATWVR